MLPAAPPHVTAWTLSHWMPPCWRYKSIWKVQTLKCTKRKWAATTAKPILLYPNGAINMHHVTFKQRGKVVHSVAWLDLSHNIDQCSCVITILRPLHNWPVQEALANPPRPLPQHINIKESNLNQNRSWTNSEINFTDPLWFQPSGNNQNHLNQQDNCYRHIWLMNAVSSHGCDKQFGHDNTHTLTNDRAEQINRHTMNQHENKTDNADRWLYGTTTNLDSTG